MEVQMDRPLDRRKFLKVSGMSLGVGALISFAPALAAGGTPVARVRNWFRRQNGEEVSPFNLVQLSDAHVGFQGPSNPTGTKAFERAIEVINGLNPQPELILFTGDLTHESETPGEHEKRMQLFKDITGRLKSKKVMYVPGEHDAALDGGALYRQFFGETHYSFDHRGVHFIALDNVSSGKPAVGAAQIEWLKRDIARYPHTAPIVVFTHRPLFDLRPDWEWFTRDGDEVLNVLSPHENVTVLYGHIHRHDVHETEHATHYASRSLIFAFPDPTTVSDKKPVAFDKEKPFKNLGLQLLAERSGPNQRPALGVDDVELTLREYAGTDGVQQISRPGASL
ncbi:MAG: serine/threonine protein phosphatase [Acidobacteria bacterium]|nr:MAG: serine/threonine protein phosphatase [Acidobacteriota bacterium]